MNVIPEPSYEECMDTLNLGRVYAQFSKVQSLATRRQVERMKGEITDSTNNTDNLYECPNPRIDETLPIRNDLHHPHGLESMV